MPPCDSTCLLRSSREARGQRSSVIPKSIASPSDGSASHNAGDVDARDRSFRAVLVVRRLRRLRNLCQPSGDAPTIR